MQKKVTLNEKLGCAALTVMASIILFIMYVSVSDDDLSFLAFFVPVILAGMMGVVDLVERTDNEKQWDKGRSDISQ